MLLLICSSPYLSFAVDFKLGISSTLKLCQVMCRGGAKFHIRQLFLLTPIKILRGFLSHHQFLQIARMTEFNESWFSHSYSVLQGKDREQKQPRKDSGHGQGSTRHEASLILCPGHQKSQHYTMVINRIWPTRTGYLNLNIQNFYITTWI